LAGLLTACNPADDYRYLHEGVGTGLYWQGLPASTEMADAYFAYICRQAGLSLGPDGACAYAGMSPRDWGIFVQAGYNDIDLRCDSYLAWLDDRKRSATPILKELSAISTATQAILNASAAGPKAITVVGIAFGLAADTFLNVQSRLLQDIDHTTVQSVVLGNQHEFRLSNLNVVVDNRPAAVYLLRNYLRICMPFSIEMSINNTVTVFQRAGPEALRTQQLITRTAVATSTTSAGVRGAPIISRRTIVRPERQAIVALPAFAQILDPYDPQVHSKAFVERIQRALCVPESEVGRVGDATMTLIDIFERSELGARPNGKLDRREITTVLGLAGNPCTPNGPQNFYERRTYTDAAAIAELVDELNRSPAGGNLTAATLGGARAKIRAVRTALSGKVMPLPAPFDSQVTKDLINALDDLQ